MILISLNLHFTLEDMENWMRWRNLCIFFCFSIFIYLSRSISKLLLLRLFLQILLLMLFPLYWICCCGIFWWIFGVLSIKYSLWLTEWVLGNFADFFLWWDFDLWWWKVTFWKLVDNLGPIMSVSIISNLNYKIIFLHLSNLKL